MPSATLSHTAPAATARLQGGCRCHQYLQPAGGCAAERRAVRPEAKPARVRPVIPPGAAIGTAGQPGRRSAQRPATLLLSERGAAARPPKNRDRPTRTGPHHRTSPAKRARPTPGPTQPTRHEPRAAARPHHRHRTAQPPGPRPAHTRQQETKRRTHGTPPKRARNAAPPYRATAGPTTPSEGTQGGP